MFGIESTAATILLIILIAGIPIFIIFTVMRKIRKSKERGEEKDHSFTLKSTDEERLEQREGKKHD